MRPQRTSFLAAACLLAAACDIPTELPIVEQRWILPFEEVTISLAKGATVNGNIYCSRLVLQDGARFNGKIEMAKQSQLKIAPKPEAVDNGPAEVENRSA
jgi:hypothetical protein